MIAIITVLLGLLLAAISKSRTTAQSVRCLSNLHGISVAFTQFAADNDARYPDPLGTGTSWESLLRPYVSEPLLYACPADSELFPSVASSYDWRDTPNVLTSLAGRRLVDVLRPDAVLAYETLPGWHTRHLMNAVLVDGSTITMSEDSCLGDLARPVFSAPPNSQGP